VPPPGVIYRGRRRPVGDLRFVPGNPRGIRTDGSPEGSPGDRPGHDRLAVASPPSGARGAPPVPRPAESLPASAQTVA